MCKKILLSLTLLLSLSIEAQVLNWNTDINDAITASKDQKKPLLILFTNNNDSDRLLDSQILKTLDFALWSRDNVILVKLDLNPGPNNENIERNQSLQKAFGVEELPQICYTNATIRKNKINYGLLGKIGYKPGGVKSWIDASTKILNFRAEEEE
ncbi:thioredoxin family protein [Flavobacterium sp. I-SCBP12n]|uniref:Thioredoxin family protein n=2 Tax=Flavobacterium TaxID=237 RepID=A0A9X1XU98_9FLAO|nr:MULTISPECIES: thioredoxin family protein [Flavobacterium]MBP4142885.1 thioredoxin family protein [Flavobacterium flabelliforme]MCK8142836.1 thioredoxin family protein [Flavobacterium pygoscelis]